MKMSAAVVVQTDTKQNMHESGLVRGRAKVSSNIEDVEEGSN